MEMIAEGKIALEVQVAATTPALGLQD